MVDHVELITKVKEALNKLFEDEGIKPSQIKEELEELQDEIQGMIESIELEEEEDEKEDDEKD